MNGFDDLQAKGLAAAMREMHDANLEGLASKGDLRVEIERIRLEIVEAKADMIPWIFGVAAGQAAFIIAILKMFPSH